MVKSCIEKKQGRQIGKRVEGKGRKVVILNRLSREKPY